jgi:hypothetical protein
LPNTGQSRKEIIAQRKKENEQRWYKSTFGEVEPEFKPLKRENEITYKLDAKTTMFAPPGSDVNLLRQKYLNRKNT